MKSTILEMAHKTLATMDMARRFLTNVVSIVSYLVNRLLWVTIQPRREVNRFTYKNLTNFA